MSAQRVPEPPFGAGAPAIVINDVTQLNPVPVWTVLKPTTVPEVQEALRRTTGPVSIGGGHFSMGGQTASPGSLHLDLRKLNQVVWFRPVDRTIRVRAGIRWCDIQHFVDPHGLAVKIMQTYANFTVGGALSVNCHGRYMGLGPLILSVRAIALVLPSGELVEASPSQNAELFYGAVGGYGGIGVIVEVELDLVPNTRVERLSITMPTSAYLEFFRNRVRGARAAVFHNADLYPPHYRRARAVTWVETEKTVTVPHRLQPIRTTYPIERYFLWAFSETPLGKWRREHIVDRFLYARRRVHWRNFEAGYDVAELEPASRKRTTYVLQEYFVPIGRFDEFVPKMAEILQRHRVNVINVSVRHALADPGSLLAWATEEVFAFVLYYKQRTRENARQRVAVWTRELIDAAISCGGRYYLPYQPHGTADQVHRAYPRMRDMFALKRRLDPEFRLRNVLWDKYYAPTLQTEPEPERAMPTSEFKTVYGQTESQDAFYLFLQNVFHLYPEDRFHTLIKEATARHDTDEAIYREILRGLRAIKPFLADLTYALPSLGKQKREMARQTLELLKGKREIDGYVEIGTTGRYYSHLKKHLRIRGPVTLVNDLPPTNSPVDILERGGLGKPFRFVPMEDYRPIPASEVPDASADLVTCYIGLHHAHPDRLGAFVRSIARILRPGGVFILRDHEVKTPAMNAFVSLAHTVFNAGLGASWDVNAREPRFFAPLAHWCEALAAAGLVDSGARLLQAHDPTDNTLLSFTKA